MRIFTVLQMEWRRLWRNKLGRSGIIVGMLIPLLYSSLYLWAFWDPYGSLNKLPVAVVNLDHGGTLKNQAVNYGRDLVKQLLSEKSLYWKYMSDAKAMDGVKSGKYYMVMKIPADFSQHLLDVNQAAPTRATLEFIPNLGQNYLAGQIVERAQGEIQAALDEKMSQHYIASLLDVVGQAKNGVSQLSHSTNLLAAATDRVHQGSIALSDGLDSAVSGAERLNKAMSQLVPGSEHITLGLQQVQAGTQQVKTGIDKANTGIAGIRAQIKPAAGPESQLATGMEQAASGAVQMSKVSRQLADRARQGAIASEQLTNGLESIATANTNMQNGVSAATSLLKQYQNAQGSSSNPLVIKALGTLQKVLPGFQTNKNGLAQVEQGTRQLTQSLATMQSGDSQLAAQMTHMGSALGQASQSTQRLTQSMGQVDHGLATIATGLGEASGGLGKLSAAEGQLGAGSHRLQSGLAESSSGMKGLTGGIQQMNAGASRLVKSTGQLASAQHKLVDKLQPTASQSSVPAPSRAAEFMSGPVKISNHPLYKVTKYGPGLTPYFVPLSLWVGALMLYFLISLREGRWRLSPVSSTEVILGKMGVLWLIGIIQSVIASAVLLYGLKLSVTHVSEFYLFNALLSMTYVTVIGMFIGALGTGPGRFIAIVLLLLQLTSSGGTFPIQLVPGFFQTIHTWLPMSYGVQGLRGIIAIDNQRQLWHMVGINTLYFVSALVALLIVRSRRPKTKHLTAPDLLVS